MPFYFVTWIYIKIQQAISEKFALWIKSWLVLFAAKKAADMLLETHRGTYTYYVHTK